MPGTSGAPRQGAGGALTGTGLPIIPHTGAQRPAKGGGEHFVVSGYWGPLAGGSRPGPAPAGGAGPAHSTLCSPLPAGARTPHSPPSPPMRAFCQHPPPRPAARWRRCRPPPPSSRCPPPAACAPQSGPGGSARPRRSCYVMGWGGGAVVMCAGSVRGLWSQHDLRDDPPIPPSQTPCPSHSTLYPFFPSARGRPAPSPHAPTRPFSTSPPITIPRLPGIPALRPAPCGAGCPRWSSQPGQRQCPRACGAEVCACVTRGEGGAGRGAGWAGPGGAGGGGARVRLSPSLASWPPHHRPLAASCLCSPRTRSRAGVCSGPHTHGASPGPLFRATRLRQSCTLCSGSQAAPSMGDAQSAAGRPARGRRHASG